MEMIWPLKSKLLIFDKQNSMTTRLKQQDCGLKKANHELAEAYNVLQYLISATFHAGVNNGLGLLPSTGVPQTSRQCLKHRALSFTRTANLSAYFPDVSLVYKHPFQLWSGNSLWSLKRAACHRTTSIGRTKPRTINTKNHPPSTHSTYSNIESHRKCTSSKR